MANTAPTVFISYRHYDGDTDFRPKVAALSQKLRDNGVDAHIDQYEEDDPPSNWATWMTQQIDRADFVLIVVTETYRRRFEGDEEEGIGLGAVWEGGAITSQMYLKGGDKHKFIPVSFGPREEWINSIPMNLVGTTSYDILPDSGFSRLLRRLHAAPAVKKPPLGKRPDFEESSATGNEVFDRNSAHLSARRVLTRDNPIEIDQYFNGFLQLYKQDLSGFKWIDESEYNSAEAISGQLKIVDLMLEPILCTYSELAFYQRSEDQTFLKRGFQALVDLDWQSMAYNYQSLQRYPGTLFLYVCGTAAMASENFNALAAILLRSKIRRTENSDPRYISALVSAPYTFDRISKLLPQPLHNAKFPASEYMLEKVRHYLEYLVPISEIELAFDQFEHFLSLVLHHHDFEGVLGGRFVYKLARLFTDPGKSNITGPIYEAILDGTWPGLKIGFIGSNMSEAELVFKDHFSKIRAADRR